MPLRLPGNEVLSPFLDLKEYIPAYDQKGKNSKKWKVATMVFSTHTLLFFSVTLTLIFGQIT